MSGYIPWHNTYLATGDVEAFEALSRWFHVQSGTLIKRQTSRAITLEQVWKESPILFGRPQTNPYIEETLRRRSAAGLGYRIHSQQGTAKIDGMREKEKRDLRTFPTTPDGVVGPIIQMDKVFGIVSRFPNPGGRGPITIISCDHYAMVIARIVEMLTDDLQAQELFDQVGWTDTQEIPTTFELLFTVDLLPGNRAAESYPQLLTWRIPD